MAETKKRDQDIGFADLPYELSERGREIWLAGLGALSRVEEEGEKIFKNLVKRGEEFEARGRQQIEASLDSLMEQQRQAARSAMSVTKTFTDAAQSVERAVANTLTDTLGRVGMPTRGEVEELSSKVSQLSEKLDALSAALEARKAEARKAEAREVKAEESIFYVVPHEKGWAVQRQGADRAASVHETKKEALDAGREEARGRAPSRLIVHKQDGSVQETYTYEDGNA